MTIKKYEEEERSFELQIPNEEVRLAISELILSDLNKDSNAKLHVLSKNIRLGFAKGDTEKAIINLETLLANTTYNTHAANQNESHYQALFQLAMTLSNIDHRGESQHWEGRTDAVLIFEKYIYAVEIKYAATKKVLTTALANAMKQIKSKHYYGPFMHQGKTVHLLALAFTQGQISFQEEIA